MAVLELDPPKMVLLVRRQFDQSRETGHWYLVVHAVGHLLNDDNDDDDNDDGDDGDDDEGVMVMMIMTVYCLVSSV